MKAKETLITLAALAAIGVVSFLAYRYETKPQLAFCNMCARPVHAGTAFRVEVNGKTEVACCPRCGMHFLMTGSAAARAWATDLNTGEPIAADAASYNAGGDVQYCATGEQPVERRPEGVSVRAFDRCLPTVVAFKTREEAEAYQRQHGGKVLNYAQVMASVREQ